MEQEKGDLTGIEREQRESTVGGEEKKKAPAPEGTEALSAVPGEDYRLDVDGREHVEARGRELVELTARVCVGIFPRAAVDIEHAVPAIFRV